MEYIKGSASDRRGCRVSIITAATRLMKPTPVDFVTALGYGSTSTIMISHKDWLRLSEIYSQNWSIQGSKCQ